MTFINTPFNYAGSKFKLLEQLLSEFDYSKNYFIDLFTGGGSIYTNIVDRYEKILANDIIEDLIGIHKGLIFDSENFIKEVKNLSPNKDNQEEYLKLRETYNKEKTAAKLYALILSCTNNLMRFNNSGGFNQTFGKRSFNESTQKKIDAFVEHITPYKDKLIFTSNSFEKIILRKSSMIYADPPYGYTIENGNITSKQISEAGYNSIWKKEHDIKLYDYLKNLHKEGHSFCMSNVWKHDGKTSWICEKLIQDGFNYKELDFNYNKVSRKKEDKETIEIIIKNY